LISVELPEGLQVIGESWFTACTSLVTVNVPSSVKEIQSSAFGDCISLASLDLPEGLQSIGYGSFLGCESLTSLRIPSTVNKMGCDAFSYCLGLRYVILPETLDTVEQFTLCMCKSLTHVRVPMSVTRIGRAAFVGCNQLISLELPEGLESIHLDQEWNPDENPFSEPKPLSVDGCRSLVNLVIPSGQLVKQLGEYDEGVMDCLKLRTVIENFDDLVSELQHRFDDLPMHRLCYYQSYYPLTEVVDNL
jgi:hypothetical protein